MYFGKVVIYYVFDFEKSQNHDQDLWTNNENFLNDNETHTKHVLKNTPYFELTD